MTTATRGQITEAVGSAEEGKMIIEISGDRQAGRDTPDDDSALAALEYSSSPVPPTIFMFAFRSLQLLHSPHTQQAVQASHGATCPEYERPLVQVQYRLHLILEQQALGDS
jgi:hypothetical protein